MDQFLGDGGIALRNGAVRLLQIPQHAWPGFHVMSGRYSTACRATIPR